MISWPPVGPTETRQILLVSYLFSFAEVYIVENYYSLYRILAILLIFRSCTSVYSQQNWLTRDYANENENDAMYKTMLFLDSLGNPVKKNKMKEWRARGGKHALFSAIVLCREMACACEIAIDRGQALAQWEKSPQLIVSRQNSFLSKRKGFIRIAQIHLLQLYQAKFQLTRNQYLEVSGLHLDSLCSVSLFE